MEKTKVWTEEVFFAECPHCEETEELGSGLVGDGEEEATCPKCHKKYLREWPE